MATATAVRPVVKARRRFDWSQPFIYFVALIVVGVSIIPVLFVMISGFRSTGDLNANPAGLPNPWILDNYLFVLSSPAFWGAFTTSTSIAVGTTLGVVVLGVMAAFVIAKYTFAGRGFLYSLFAAGLMFPLTVAMLPLNLMIRNFGLHGNWLGVIIPQIAFSLPTTVIILVPFLKAIPDELEEAASIDGASRVGFFWRILLPLSMPGLVTVGVLAFIGSWNGFLLPLLILAAGGAPPEQWPLPLGTYQFSSQYATDIGALLAYTSLSMLPAIIFFLFAQKRIVGGLTGAVKG